MSFYEHSLGASSVEVLETVAKWLTDLNYSVPDEPEMAFSCEEDGCGGCETHWEITVYGSVERAFAENGREDIRGVCDAHGVTYLGGGMGIGLF